MQKKDNLQGLRAVAFIMIFLSHCGIGDLAGLAVTIFFVLSGFLLVYNYFPKGNIECSIKDNVKFSYKRINKLYALHLLMIFPVLALSLYSGMKNGTLNLEFALNEALKLLPNILLLQSWIPERAFYFSFNGVSWFLSVCTFLYFIFPYVLKSMNHIWSCKKAVLAIILCFLIQCSVAAFGKVVSCEWISEHIIYLTYISPLYRVFDLLIGCNVGYLFLRSKNRHGASSVWFTLLEVLSVFIALSLPFVLACLGLESILPSAKDMPGVIMLIFVLGFNKGLVSKILSTKVMVTLGNISGYTFLIHQVVINLCQIVIENKYIVALIAFAATIAIAFAYGWLNKVRYTRRT